MEDIGHSRLLKFLVNGKEKNKMEAPVFKIQFEYITPTNIESEVPGKQDIREASEEIATENSLDNKVENPEDYVLSPVITVTKQESEFTKGDLKLQKVSVTENISEGVSAGYTIDYIINSNPNIQSEVIRTQPVRVMEDERKTRIPTLKTKQQVERRRSVDKKDEVLPSRLLQKRSSIPRLKDSRIPPPLDRRTSKPDVKMETPQPDEEFEKIYGEIISEPKEIVTDIIESIKVDDPEKLDNKFEEIIHDYEENKIQPITVDVSVKINKPRSKIPLSKRKSEQDIKIPTAAEKISVNDKPKLEKIETRLPVHKDLSHKTGKIKYNIRYDDKPNTVNIIDINEPKIIQKSNIDDSIEPVKVAKKEIIETKMKESIVKDDNKPISNDVKVISENTSDVALSNVINTEPEIIPELIQQKNIVIIDPIITNPNDIKNGIKIRENQINEIVPILDNNKHYSKNDEKQNMDTEYKPGKVSRLLQRIRSQEFGTDNLNPKKEIVIDVPKKKTVLSKIAMFERQDSDEDKLRIKPPLIKSKEIKSEILSEKIVDRKPVIVDELLKESNLDSIESVNTIECPSIENFDNLKKDYTVEIQNDKVKYLEIQDDDPDANDKYRTSTQFVTNRIYLDKTVDLSPNNEGIEPLSLKNKLVDIKNKIGIMKQNSRELLEPTPQNFDENVSRDTVIETTEYISTNYTTNAPIQKEKSDDLDLNDSETIEYDPYNCDNKQNIPNDNTIQDYPNIKDEKSNNIFDDKIDIPFVNITVKETKIETLEIGPMSFDDKVENDVFSKSSKVEMREVLNKNREITNERMKSVAQLDLEDVIKGKLHQMIVRMNSVEKIENNRKEINPRERPRKKSVSKIIALFEQKSYQIEPPTTHRPDLTTKTPQPPSTITEEEYQLKITELANGKVVHGRVENMTYMVLSNGVEMPVLAVGTALLDKRLVRPVIEAAIDMGYRAIDSAYIYGNEEEVGQAIKAKIDDGTVTRADLFIISKLWSTFHRPDLVSTACNASLKAMGLKYFDLYLIHNPVSFKEGPDPIPKIANVVQYSSSDFMDAWYGMEALIAEGTVKSIGLSNFNSRQVQKIFEKAKVKPVINQVECHPYLSQRPLSNFCSERDVKLSCFGVLGSKGTPKDYTSGLPAVIDDPLVQVIAAGLNITTAQLLIRYQIDSGHNVVVKASSAAHLWENLQALNVTIDPTQLKALGALNKNKRIFTFVGIGDTHRNYPFRIPF